MTTSAATANLDPTDRNDAIKLIRQSLRQRSGKAWSVRGDRGSAWGWIKVSSPPARCADQWGTMAEAECKELGELLGLSRPAHHQGVTIPDGSDYRREYVDR